MSRMRLLGLLALVGCFGSDYQAHLDPGIAPMVQTAARAAAADWMANVPVTISFAPAACSAARAQGMMCIHPVATIPFIPWQPDAAGSFSAYTIDTDMWIAEPLLETRGPAFAQRTIAHEMGHVMGLSHTIGHTLMNPDNNVGAWTVTAVDVAQWQAVREIQSDIGATAPSGGGTP